MPADQPATAAHSPSHTTMLDAALNMVVCQDCDHKQPATAATFPFDPDWVVPTSDMLREWMEDNGITSTRTIAAIGAHPDYRDEVAARLRGVLDSDEPLTDDLACVVARATGVSKAFWLNFERNYQVGLAAGKTVIGRD